MKDPSTFRAFVRELRRRRVHRVAILYLTGGFLAVEALDMVFSTLGAPPSLSALVVVLWTTGLPVALCLGWAYDLTSEGLRADEGDSLSEILGTRHTPRLLVVVVVAAVSLGTGLTGWFVWLRPAEGAEATALRETEAGPPDPSRLAVLYFDDHSPDGELAYLADAFTEGLIHELSQVEPLEVISRNGVKPFRDQPVSTDSIVSSLRVGSIVEGSVTSSPDRIRVTAQLIDAASDAHLESLTFERARDDLFALQEDLAREVADALRRRLGEELHVREVRSGTSSQDAWIAVHRAERLLEDAETAGRRDVELGKRLLLRADSLLAVAEALDPAWALPAVRRADASGALAGLEGPVAGTLDPEQARTGIAHARRALEKDPESAEAHHRLGRLQHQLSLGGGQDASELRAEAGDHLRQAVELDPSLGAAWVELSEWFMSEGRFDESAWAANQALEADAFLEVPTEVLLHQRYYAALQQGPEERARTLCDEGYARFPGRPAFLTCQLFILASFPQVPPDVARAWRLRDSLVTASSAGRAMQMREFGTIQVAKVVARAEMADSARATLRRALGEETPPHLTYDEAHFWVLMGQPDSATRYLRRYLAEYPDTAWLAQDWWFEPLRSHDGFRALVGLDEDG